MAVAARTGAELQHRVELAVVEWGAWVHVIPDVQIWGKHNAGRSATAHAGVDTSV